MRIFSTLILGALLAESAFAQNVSRESQSTEVVLDTVNTVSIATAGKDSSNFKAWYLNDTLKVAGVVTTANFQSSYNSTAYCIQDSTGGIYLYYGKTPSINLSVGDSVSVIGQIKQYHGLTEIEPLDPSHVTMIKHNAVVPDPVRLTLHQVANAHVIESYESMLVEVDTLYKSSGTWPAAGSNASIYVTDSAGAVKAQLYINKNTDIPGTSEHLYPVNVRAVISQYGTDSTGYEIMPLDTTDIWRTPGVVSRATIAQARVDANHDFIPDFKVTGDTLEVVGVVISPDIGSSTYSSYYIQDNSGGINVYVHGAKMPFEIGDSVFVVGTIYQNKGLTEIEPLAADSAHFGLIEHAAVLPNPKRLSLHEYLMNAETVEGSLVEIDSLYKASGTWGKGKNVYVTNASGSDTTVLYLNSYTNTGLSAEPTYPINLVGLASQYSSSVPPNNGYEIIPRDSLDITKSSVTPPPTMKKVTIAEARVQHNWVPDLSVSGDTVEISGVVVSPNIGGYYTSYFIQDGTAGIDVYSKALMNFEVGDSVFVVGTILQYNGLAEIQPLAGDSLHLGLLKHNAVLPKPVVLNLHEFARNAAYAELYEGQLVELDSLFKAYGDWPTAGSNASIYLTDLSKADTAQFFVNKNTNVPGWKEPEYPINVVGVVSQYGTDSTGYELIPRDTSDITHFTIVGVDEKPNGIPPDFYLAQNYPNPFNPSTTIRYGLPKDAQVQISVYNILGQRVALLVEERERAGNHEVVFNADRLASGVYLYVMRADNHVFKQKMLLIK